MNNQFPASRTPIQPGISFYNPQKDSNSNNSATYPNSSSNVPGFIPGSKSYIARSNILDQPKAISSNTGFIKSTN